MPERFFYGWAIALGSSAISFAGVGIAFYMNTILQRELSVAHGWSISAVAAAASLFFVVSGVSGVLIGRLVDRLGGRVFIVAGGFGLALAFVWLGRLDTLPELYGAYALLAFSFALCGNVPNNAIVARWFVAWRARALAVSHTGVSIAGILIVPLAATLIVERGLEFTTLALAGLVLAIVLPVTLFVLRSDPARHGLDPDGSLTALEGHPHIDRASQVRVWGTTEAMRTTTFWLLAFAFGAILTSQVGFLVHQYSVVERALDARTGALAISTTATCSIIGRAIVGFFADRLDKRRVATALFVVQGASIALFAASGAEPGLFAASAMFGFTMGNIFLMQSLIAGELFGAASFGAVFGALQFCTQLASGIGPLFVGILVDWLGGYPEALASLACVSWLAALTLWQVRPPPAAPEETA